jgi:hypothetical protein
MKAYQLPQIEIAETIAIRHHERVVVDVFLDRLHARARHAVGARLREGDDEVLFLVRTMIAQTTLRTEAARKVIVHRLVVEEILLDHVASVTETKDEVSEAVMCIELHDVPKERSPTHIDQRLGPILGFLTKSRSLATA